MFREWGTGGIFGGFGGVRVCVCARFGTKGVMES